MPKEVIELLNQLMLEEEKKLVAGIPSDKEQKKVVLFSLIKGFDTFYMFSKNKESCIYNYQYGWLKALGLAYGNYTNEGPYPLFKSNEKLLTNAHAFIYHVANVEFCKKSISFLKAKLASAKRDEKNITLEFQNIGIEEEFDQKTFDWVHDLVKERFSQPKIDEIMKGIDGIRKKMRALVSPWREHFIQYDTTPEIDDFFNKLAVYHLFHDEHKEEILPDALFGGVPYKKYCDMVTVEYGIALKHYYFCLELYNKCKEHIQMADIMTITRDRKEHIKSMAEYMEVSLVDSEKMIDAITLSSENVQYHSCRPRAAPPPFVKISENAIVASIAAFRISPFDFLNQELRRKYKKDYFSAVNNREEVFRKQLYDFFREDNFVKITKNVQFSCSKGKSDIDALIYDKNYGVLGVFQLKWQEMYGASMKERYSRISNLYPKATEWIEKVEAWINESNKNDVFNKLGISCKRDIAKVLIFVVCRHGTYFTNQKPDERAAWASIWLIIKIFSQIPENIPNKIDILHSLIFQEYDALKKVKKNTLEEDTFHIGGYKIALKTI